MIKAQKLQKSYGSMTVLSDISFSLGRGQKVALVADQLMKNLENYRKEKIYLLRGVDQMYFDLNNKQRVISQEIFNDRSRFYVLSPQN